MRSFTLNKLVRDKVFTSMQELGQQITFRKLTDQEILPEMGKKLLEEANEFSPSDPNAENELADLLEVIEQLGKELGKEFEALRILQLKRRKERGSFDERIYVERLDLADEDPWVKYYAADPIRFPETKQIE